MKDLTDGEIVLHLTGTGQAVPERDILPAYYFDIMSTDGARVGTCDLRIGEAGINGNVGYTVFPPYRGHRYAAKACRLLLSAAGECGMDRLCITCREDNAASCRTAELCGGVLTESLTVPEDSALYRRGARRIRIYTAETGRKRS